MQTKDENIQDLINFLHRKLVDHGFTFIGPRTLLLNNGRDTILVKVTDRNLIIITDGEFVLDSETMIPITNRFTPNMSDRFDSFNVMYLQPILSLF